jgi:hypothetical protein
MSLKQPYNREIAEGRKEGRREARKRGKEKICKNEGQKEMR